MKTIRASEIGIYIYCQRAWWYHQQGIHSDNQDELASGNELHQHHGRVVMISSFLKGLAYLILLTALVLLTIYLIGRYL